MITRPSAPFLFVVDTVGYAGAFERALCAYLTGRVGECGVGGEMAARYARETGAAPFAGVIDVADEHGCARPCTIYPTPGWFNNGYGFLRKEAEPSSAAAALVAYHAEVQRDHDARVRFPKAALKIHAKGTKKQKADLIESRWTKAACEQEIGLAADFLREGLSEKKVRKYPAYLSVAIFFGEKPTTEQVAIMKSRAEAFLRIPSCCGCRNAEMKEITGYRLLRTVKGSTRKVNL
jgi:hypothetical protein